MKKRSRKRKGLKRCMFHGSHTSEGSEWTVNRLDVHPVCAAHVRALQITRQITGAAPFRGERDGT